MLLLSLLLLLCKNIVQRAKDPLSTTSTSSTKLGLINTKIFSIDILVILFSFLNFRDLLNFGYCSQITYNICNNTQLWKTMYLMEEYHVIDKDEIKSIVNWKNKFLTQFVRLKYK